MEKQLLRNLSLPPGCPCSITLPGVNRGGLLQVYRIARTLAVRPLNSYFKRSTRTFADGFVTDAVDLITDDGMHLFGIANHGKCDRHGAGDEAVFGHAPESFSEVV